MPKLKVLVAELDEIQRKLSEVEANMGKATSVLELQLFELEETKLVEAYQRKNAELLRKKQRLRKKEFAQQQQSGTSLLGVLSLEAFILGPSPHPSLQSAGEAWRALFSPITNKHTATPSSLWSALGVLIPCNSRTNPLLEGCFPPESTCWMA